jgi:glycerophosphoryl diester phosphodiesterase
MPEQSDWTRPHPLWIVAHRGAPGRARENTLDSFDFAEALGADAIELDLQQSRDGELVVFHDEEIPIGTARHAIRSMAALDIRALRLDSAFGEYRIPTFEQVLSRYGPSLRYVVEVKCGPATNRALAARRIAGLAGAFGSLARCLVCSFDADLVRRVQETEPGLAVSLLFDRPVSLSDARLPRTDAVGPRHDLVTAALAADAAASGRSLHPWTVDDPQEMRRLAALGVASITTNDCEAARRALGA